MPHSAWQVESQRAALHGHTLAAILELTRPGLGLHQIQVGAASLRDCHLLGVQWGEGGAGASRALSDSYVRGGDLIATYTEEPQRPYAPQVYWRAIGSADSQSAGADRPATQLELLVSVQTRLLDAQPEMTATSRLSAVEVLHLVDTEEGRFSNVDPGRSEVSIQPQDGTGCLLLRLAGGQLSYVQMVHPLDFIQGRLSVVAAADSALLTHTLIDCRMEKGVIIRTRVRGCFVDRANDTSAAVSLYEAFADSALPLSA